MKRIILLATVLSVPLVAMEDTQLKRSAELEIDVPAKKAKTVVNNPEKLFDKSLAALLKAMQESGEDIVAFVERAMPRLNDTLCAALIKKYALDKQNDRLELAAYCAYKSCSGESNALINLAEKRKQEIKQPDGDNAFVVVALELLAHALKEARADRAVLQPLTFACMRAYTPPVSGACHYDRQKGYGLIRDYLLSVIHKDDVMPTLRQLIMYDGEKTLIALIDSLSKKGDSWAKAIQKQELWQLADLFNREHILLLFSKVNGKRLLDVHECHERLHLNPHLERSVCRGDLTIIEQLKKNPLAKVRQNEVCQSPFTIAALSGYTSFMQAYKKAIPIADESVEDAFYAAVRNGQTESVKCLSSMLPKNYKPDYCDDDQVFIRGHLDTIHFLANTFPEQEHLDVLLEKACIYGLDALTQMLLEKIKPQDELLYMAHLFISEPMPVNGECSKLQKMQSIRMAICIAARLSSKALHWFLSRNVPVHGFLAQDRLYLGAYSTNPLHAALTGIYVYPHETLETVKLLLHYGAYDEPDIQNITGISRMKQAIEINNFAPNKERIDKVKMIAQEIEGLITEQTARRANLAPQSLCHTEGLVQYFKKTNDKK